MQPKNLTHETAKAYGLTLASLTYFAHICDDAKNWEGVALITGNDGKGHLKAIEKAKLIITERDEMMDKNLRLNGDCCNIWALLTPRGAALAAEIGYAGIAPCQP